jgi:hypothetical protein
MGVESEYVGACIVDAQQTLDKTVFHLFSPFSSSFGVIFVAVKSSRDRMKENGKRTSGVIRSSLQCPAYAREILFNCYKYDAKWAGEWEK